MSTPLSLSACLAYRDMRSVCHETAVVLVYAARKIQTLLDRQANRSLFKQDAHLLRNTAPGQLETSFTEADIPTHLMKRAAKTASVMGSMVNRSG